MKVLNRQVCPYCEKIATESGTICSACKIKLLSKNKSVPLDGLFVCARYKDLAHLVYAYKYNFLSDLSVPLSKLMATACLSRDLPLPDLIVPVPLHKKRKKWRGFNQAELLADGLSLNLSPGYVLPVGKNLILRKKFTAPQMKIKNYKERRKNLQSAFCLNPDMPASNPPIVNPTKKTGLDRDNKKFQSFRDKNIFLIDDICTTGSTLFECGRVLKKAGAKTVWGLVLARQEFASKS